jgi:N-acetylneuraminate synthase
MSTLEQVDAALCVIGRTNNPVVVMHCVSTYPSENSQLNLRCIPFLRDHFNELVGYSGHEKGLATTLAAVAIGACVVERHITLDRTMWGSDQAASLEPHALCRLVRDIRAVEAALGDGVKRVLKEEEPIAAKLRRVA